MVTFKNDLDTFCKYVALRPPNVDHIVYQHIEDRFLEKAIRGLYYVARYQHQPEEGEAITVVLDQYCGRLDPDAEGNAEAQMTAAKIAAVDQRVIDATAQTGGEVYKGALKYTGEIVQSSEWRHSR